MPDGSCLRVAALAGSAIALLVLVPFLCHTITVLIVRMWQWALRETERWDALDDAARQRATARQARERERDAIRRSVRELGPDDDDDV